MQALTLDFGAVPLRPPFPIWMIPIFCSHLAPISAVQAFLDRYPVDEDMGQTVLILIVSIGRKLASFAAGFLALS